MSSPARIEQQPIAQGNLFLALVGVGTLFMLFLAMIPAMKAGPLFNEENMLYVSLIFYAAATVLYVGFAITGTERYVRAAWVGTWLGFIASTAAVGHRWYVAGHAPFASVYEMLLVFVWALGATTLFVQKKYGVKVIGTISMPLAVVGIILMQLMPSAVRPLVPALQSTWLHVHVALAMLAYAAAAVSFALAMMFLIQDKMRTETFLANTAGFVAVIYGAILGRFHEGGLKVVALNADGGGDLFVQRGVPLMLVIPELGWLFVLTFVAALAPVALYAWGWFVGDESKYEWANRAFFLGMVMQVITTGAFIVRARGGSYVPAPIGAQVIDGVFPTRLSNSPFLLTGLLTALMASLLYLMMRWRRDGLQRMLPSAQRLDSLTYKAIGICFPLMTLMIAAGAYWANQTWGSYWSWDPKETAALITWIVYAGYLHMRIARGWRGRRAAYFAILGFAVVMFTFFGVTYLLPGLHAYA